MWNFDVVSALVGRAVAGDRTLSPATLVLCMSALSKMDFQGSWIDDSGALSDEDFDTVDNWVATALLELMTEATGGEMSVPTGYIMASAGPIASGWLLCDGTQYLRTTYPALYAVLDTAFIIDADNFVVPDLLDRVIVGAGDTYDMGDTGGEATHQLTEAELPAHTHEITRATSYGSTFRLSGGSSSTAGYSNTSSVGSDTPHNNMPPFMSLYYVIKT